MTVTEFARFKLLEPYTTSSPEILTLLSSVNAKQGSFSGYPVRFYQDVSEPSLVYLVSGWKSVEEHHKWMNSDVNKELLAQLEWQKLLTIEGLAHLEVDFEKLPEDYKGLAYAVSKDSSIESQSYKAPAPFRQYTVKDLTSTSNEIYPFVVFDGDTKGAEGSWDGVATKLVI